jgi:uncharacterized protein (TIRG00374 family)
VTKKNAKSIIQFVVLLGIGVLLIWLSLRKITPAEKDAIIASFKSANYFWVFISLLIAFFGHFLRAYRWNYLLKPLGYQTNLLNATCHVFVGYGANYGIPRAGEISRCTLAAKYDKVPFEIALGTVITERIVDFFIFILIFILTLALQFKQLIGLANEYVFDKLKVRLYTLGQSPMKLIILISVILIFVSAFFLLRKKVASLLKGKLGGIIKGFGQGLGSVKKMEKPFQFIVLSLLIWATYFYSLYVCFFALGGTSNLGQRECLTLLLFGTFGVILTPGGLGAYPAILTGILLTYHVDGPSSFALPWLSWTSQFILILSLCMISLIVLPIYNRNKNGVS